MSGCDGDDPARTDDVSGAPAGGPLSGAEGEMLGGGDPMIIVSPGCGATGGGV